ncbi:hypothetical protein SL180013_35730 [Salmonella enterica subsp. enterica serovar Senftenberg]|nr:hypothetical protein SL180013_35730 [Salmonella enterica subsp. enterica serovar Senftenberg]
MKKNKYTHHGIFFSSVSICSKATNVHKSPNAITENLTISPIPIEIKLTGNP